MVCAYLIQAIVFGQLGLLSMSGAVLIEYYILSAVITGLALWQHRANIKRLLNGTENKLGMKKE